MYKNPAPTIDIVITDGTGHTTNIFYGDGKGNYKNQDEIDFRKSLEIKAFRDSIYGK